MLFFHSRFKTNFLFFRTLSSLLHTSTWNSVVISAPENIAPEQKCRRINDTRLAHETTSEKGEILVSWKKYLNFCILKWDHAWYFWTSKENIVIAKITTLHFLWDYYRFKIFQFFQRDVGICVSNNNCQFGACFEWVPISFYAIAEFATMNNTYNTINTYLR